MRGVHFVTDAEGKRWPCSSTWNVRGLDGTIRPHVLAGDYRAIYSIDDDEHRVVILGVRHRSHAYD